MHESPQPRTKVGARELGVERQRNKSEVTSFKIGEIFPHAFLLVVLDRFDDFGVDLEQAEARWNLIRPDDEQIHP
jgi:hypothetical protein